METTVIDWWWSDYQSSAHKSLRLLRFCCASERSINIQIPTKLGRERIEGVMTEKSYERNLMKWLMIWTMLILFPQTCIPSHQEALLYVWRTTKQWSRWSLKGSSPTMRHVSRTHRVALYWLFDRINFDPQNPNQIHWHQKPTLRTYWLRGNVTRDEWNHLLCLFNISHFSSTNCSEVMSKRTQKDSGEERVTAKSKPMMNLFPAMQRKESWRACLNCITKPGRKQDMKVNYLWAHEQHQRTGRPVEDAYSSSYSEWECWRKLVFSIVEICWRWWK